MSFHAEAIRPQFPSLNPPGTDGALPIFLDNPAGTQVPLCVMQAATEYYMTMNANSGGAFATSQRSDRMARRTRESVADFLNAPDAAEIVIGPNMTTLSFSLSRSIARLLAPGDEIVLTRLDHDANVAPWLHIAGERGLKIKWVDIHAADCALDMASLEAALGERTQVVATAHASNAVGTLTPIAQIADMAHAVGAWHIVDAVQSAPHEPIDVAALGCDFLLCSAYKFYGPHLGLMWGRRELLEALPAYKVRPAKDAAPHRWENGTPSYETWNGLLACLAYWEYLGETFGDADLPQYQGARQQMKRGMLAVQAYERQLTKALIEGLRAMPGVTIAGISDSERFDQRVPTVSMVKEGSAPDDIAGYLARNDVYVWSGHYYAPEIMRALKRPEGMVRIGIGQYNTIDEINKLLNLLDRL